jgi:N-dimethylarginine dimethylaminohydrolase
MINIGVANEFGELRTVVMRYAAGTGLKLDAPSTLSPVLDRQLGTSDWASFDTAIVRTQQEGLIEILRGRGVEVLMADEAPDCYAGHYTRDIGFAIDDVFIMARLNSPRRQGEAAGIRRIIEQVSRVAYLDTGTIEGGDVMLHDGVVLVGMGEETSSRGVDALRYRLARLGIEREVIPVRFAHDGIVHLDDHFNIVAPGIALIHKSAFPAERLKWFDRRFDLIPVTGQEARAVQVNALSLSPDTVVISAMSDRIASELADRGIEPIPVDYSEVTKIPGSFRCSTLPLARG